MQTGILHETLKVITYFEDLGADGIVVLKWILRKYCGRV
jgi:hypothetical protein